MLNLRASLARKILNHPEFSALLERYAGGGRSTPLIGRLELEAMDTVQHFPQKDIVSFQLSRFNSIVGYAHKNVPFWQEKLQSYKTRLCALSDIESIPILTRVNINAKPSSFISTRGNLQSTYSLTTSGSTSIPVRFYINRELYYRRAFAFHYALKCFGQNPWARVLRLNYQDMPWSAYQGTYFSVMNGQKDTHQFYNFIRTYKPDAFYGTPSHLLLLADILRSNPLDYRVRFAVSRSEYLSEENKKYLEKIFGCKVFNIYASREFGPLAQECVVGGGFHLNEDRFFFEIIDESGKAVPDNSIGRILITSFDNKIMPFIRYEIGDLGRFLPGYCACGIQTKKIAFEGRSCDFIYLPDGNRFPLIRLLDSVNLPHKIKAYQFIQKSKAALKIKVVPDAEYLPADVSFIEEKVREQTGRLSSFRVSVEPVKAIKLLENGKSKMLISTVVK